MSYCENGAPNTEIACEILNIFWNINICFRFYQLVIDGVIIGEYDYGIFSPSLEEYVTSSFRSVRYQK